jgi:staphylococcal nuclease domain-containing protein 1
MPLDSQAFIHEWKGKQLDGRWFNFLTTLTILSFLAIVESVRDATTLRVRLLMPEGEHQFVNVTLAGARSPRAASKQGETSEPWADEVSRIRGPSCATWETNFLY